MVDQRPTIALPVGRDPTLRVIPMPADAKYVLERVSGCHGFYGASSMERLPVEMAIKSQVEAFKGLTTGTVS